MSLAGRSKACVERPCPVTVYTPLRPFPAAHRASYCRGKPLLACERFELVRAAFGVWPNPRAVLQTRLPRSVWQRLLASNTPGVAVRTPLPLVLVVPLCAACHTRTTTRRAQHTRPRLPAPDACTRTGARDVDFPSPRRPLVRSLRTRRSLPASRTDWLRCWLFAARQYCSLDCRRVRRVLLPSP